MFTSLLVPVDLGDLACSKTAIDAAARLAAQWKAQLRLLYVMPIVPSTYLEYVPSDFESTEKARVEAELKALATSLGLPAGTVTTAIRAGAVYPEVLAEAEAAKTDLIVVASHWPTMVTYLVGSHATSIVRHAGCSVLVLRGEAK